MAYRTLRVGFEQRERHAVSVPKKFKNTRIMEKKTIAPTIAEQKQEFFNGSIQEFTDEMNVCVSCLMSAYTSLEKLDVRNTSVFLLEKEESHV